MYKRQAEAAGKSMAFTRSKSVVKLLLMIPVTRMAGLWFREMWIRDRFYMEGNFMKDFMSVLLMKRDVFKLHLSLNAGKHFGNFRLSDGRLFSINLTDFPVTAHGLSLIHICFSRLFARLLTLPNEGLPLNLMIPSFDGGAGGGRIFPGIAGAVLCLAGLWMLWHGWCRNGKKG